MKTRFWELYRNSEDGKKLVGLFNPERELHDILAEEIFKWQHKTDQNEDLPERCCKQFIAIAENVEHQNLLLEGENAKELFETFIDEFEIKELLGESDFGDVLIAKNEYRHKLELLSELSIYLYLHYEFYKPILFQHNFSVIQRACDTLGIKLPPVPQTKDHRKYLLYYFDICMAFSEFQRENELSDAEFCACLYGFASMFENKTESELPSPTNIWMTGASSHDVELLNKGMSESIWACNERTRRGDIVIIYALSPHSCIHSIWRANSNGIFNPFDYYHCRTTVKDGIIIPPILLKELKEHPHFSQLPIVRKNMQGVNGVELTAQDYSELLKIITEKGVDFGKLPKLFDPAEYETPEIIVEKDVEEKIFIPLLEMLGYDEKDYTRQLSMKTGRGVSAIPDFVFFPKGEKYFETSPFVAEAKLKINTITEFNDAFEQAFSYANLLHSTMMAIFDKERIIIYDTSKGMPNRDNPIFEKHWAMIHTDQSAFHRLKQLIGMEIVKSI